MVDNTAFCNTWHLVYLWSKDWTLFLSSWWLRIYKAARGPEGGIDEGGETMWRWLWLFRDPRDPEKNFLMNALDIKMSSGNTSKTSNSISNNNANKY